MKEQLLPVCTLVLMQYWAVPGLMAEWYVKFKKKKKKKSKFVPILCLIVHVSSSIEDFRNIQSKLFKVLGQKYLVFNLF